MFKRRPKLPEIQRVVEVSRLGHGLGSATNAVRPWIDGEPFA